MMSESNGLPTFEVLVNASGSGAELGLRSIQRAIMVQIVNADFETVFGEEQS